jgi:curved DNA-binding protein CbpA
MTDWQDHYFVLGLDRNASQDEIKEAYRFKAFTLHPDRLIGAPESKKHRAEEELKKLNAAYEILKDPQKRNQYNLELDKRTQSNVKTKPNQPPVLTKLECDHPSPQISGSTIAWTARASDPDGDPISYRFWLKGASTANIWSPMTEWTKDNRWIWKTTSKNVGDNQIKAEVRDGYHAGTSGSDDFKIIDMKINKNWNSRFEMNDIEKKFFDAASKRIPDLNPQYEVRTSSGKLYRIDFAKIINYDPKRNKLLKIAIELDGEGHGEKEQRTYDAERQHNLELDGWRFIRFTGSQIYKDINHCIDVTEKLFEKLLKDLPEKKPLEFPSV